MGEATLLGTCTLADFGETPWGAPLPGDLTACGEPAIAAVTLACVHEHIDPALACATCAAELQRQEDVLVCPRCEDGPEPHECPVVMKIKWLV